MYVCICKAVTDKDICAGVAEAMTDANVRADACSVARIRENLRDSLDVANTCGKCVPVADKIIRQVLATQYTPQLSSS